MKTILVPTDFSKNAFNAVKYACAYAEKTKSKIILFHSYENPTGELVIPFTTVVHIGKQEAKEGADLKMKKLIATLSKTFPNSKPKWETQPGMAYDNIIDYVKKNKVDLIIMGTTGQGAVMRVLVGSTTSKVITDTACTIIAVPPKAKFKDIHKIAVATDLETVHSFAETELISFAKQHHTEITFVYIQDLATYNTDELLKKIVDKTKKHLNYKKIF
jgi:nucleotide-binding universal stress UspA family protein